MELLKALLSVLVGLALLSAWVWAIWVYALGSG
jgi:hypothetical protein